MVLRFVIQSECNPGYLGDVKPVIARCFGRSPFCGSQFLSSASFVSNNIPVVNQPIPVVSVCSAELVFQF